MYLLKIINSKEELHQEIEKLIIYLGIKKNSINLEKIENDLLELKKNDNICKIENLCKIINKFNVTKTDKIKIIENKLNEFNNKNGNNINKMPNYTKIINEFKNLNFKILSDNNEKYLDILNDLIENETLFEFIFTKKYQDIREFTNAFDDLDSNRLKIKDVEDL